jgi:photosystem I P700 chlorophyll a apoprotein A1
MAFHGSYFSNFGAWLEDPYHVASSCQVVSSIVGQDIFNSATGGGFLGIHSTSGYFNLWSSIGVTSINSLKLIAASSLASSILALIGSYLTMHIISPSNYVTVGSSSLWYFKSFNGLNPASSSLYYLTLTTSIASILWSGHLFHVSTVSDLIASNNLTSSASAIRSILDYYPEENQLSLAPQNQLTNTNNFKIIIIKYN